MEDYSSVEDEALIIWNSTLGIRVWSSVGKIENGMAWLEIPYEMVGPICLDTLLEEGAVDFAACTVMTRDRWEQDQFSLRRDAMRRLQEAEAERNDAVNRFNRRKQHQRSSKEAGDESACRLLLELPESGSLDVVQIKAAFRKKARILHPDSGGSHEEFIAISEAKSLLMTLFLDQ